MNFDDETVARPNVDTNDQSSTTLDTQQGPEENAISADIDKGYSHNFSSSYEKMKLQRI